MRLLITGGSGLLALNWAIIARNYADVTLLSHSRPVLLAGVNTLQSELDDPNTLVDLIGRIEPDVLINTAAMTNVDACEQNPEGAHQANVAIPAYLANVARRLNIKFVHISTDHVFDGRSSFWKENSPVHPLNEYARTKLAGEEKVLLEYPHALIARTNFYGWGTRVKQSFSDWIITSLRSGNSIPAFHDVYFSPLLIGQLVDGITKLLAKNASGVFHLGCSSRLSKYDFALVLARVFELDDRLIRRTSISELQLSANRPRDMSLACDKARDLLGTSLGAVEEGIVELKRQESERSSELYSALAGA